MDEVMNKFYTLREYVDREKLLKEIEDERIHEVFHKRYKKDTDQFMYAWVMLAGMKTEIEKTLFKFVRKKYFIEYMQMLGMNETVDETWIREWKHFFLLYFQISSNSREYNSKFLNFGKLKENEFYIKLEKEIQLITEKLPAFYGYSEECKLLNKTALEALEEFKKTRTQQQYIL